MGDSRAEDNMLESAKQLEGKGLSDAALDMVFDKLDDLLLDGRFDDCDLLLGTVDPGGLSTAILLVILTATLSASHRLPQRGKLMGLVRKAFRGRGLDADKLLAGLEGECPEFVRAGGDAVCQSCGKVYYDHPQHGGFPFLNILCDGTAVKL